MTDDADRPVLLTVCLGNICRSPTAEAALREAAAAAGVNLEVRSAGTGSWHIGERPDRRMRAAAAAAGLDVDGEAQQVDAKLMEAADVVFAMDRSNASDLRAIADAHGLATPIRMFREFDPEANEIDVPDPYYGGPDGFDEVVDICRRAAQQIVMQLDELLVARHHT